MVIKAYELMAAAAKEPEKYEGKKYLVVGPAAIIRLGQAVFNVYIENGFMKSGNGRTAFIASNVDVEEILPYVTFQEAAASGKRFRYAGWCKDGYKTVTEAVTGFVYYQPGEIIPLLSEKKWLIEPEG